MRSSSREEIVEVLDVLEAGYKRALDLVFDVLTTPERLRVLERWEGFRRQQPAIEHPLINQLAEQAGPVELGGRLAPVLADRLPINRAEASRRVHEAADLGQRRALNGQALPPVLEATAAAQRNGDLGAGHVAVIRGFFHRLPDFVDIETRSTAEAQLARLAGEHRPDELAKLADKLTDCLNPDGDFTDIDRAKRRGLTLGKQDVDGISAISGWLTPQARATIDAVFAKLSAPGMCNPADDEPWVSGTPSQAAIHGDTRSAPQRHHDALQQRHLRDQRQAPACVRADAGDVDLSTPQGQLVARLKGAVARHEIDHKRARQLRATRQAAERGVPNWTRACGFFDDTRQPDPATAPLLKQAHAAVLAGASLGDVCRLFNEAGAMTVDGKP